jgi:hypothetical protein
MIRRLRYSESERRLLELIPTDGKVITTKELTEKRYADEQTPFNGGAIVLAILSHLMRKVDYNKEDFRIIKSKRNGPRPLDVWTEKRKPPRSVAEHDTRRKD